LWFLAFITGSEIITSAIEEVRSNGGLSIAHEYIKKDKVVYVSIELEIVGDQCCIEIFPTV